ncbi:MAG: M14 family metallopeptidase [Planctomycetota bacterium]|nr:M14 family metallopeptidase [Planctomycetota bacterium]
MNTPIKTIQLLLLCVLWIFPTSPAIAQQQVPSRVDIAFNRYYDYDEITDLLHQLVEAYPELLSLQSLGKSEQGREMWMVTLNNPETGDDSEKPAMWIDGNVHGNEVQAAETVLYTIWYLAKSYGEVEPLTKLMDRCAFYLLPMQNPDGRDYWFDEPNTPSSSRSGQRPTDNDYDGQLDEDGPEDLDGDGHIGRMWRFDPNGMFRRNAKDPRIIERVGDGEKGELSRAGSEGIDNDGDGRINEDGPGGYDMNRNWPTDWQPNYIQFGAGDYPFDRPETKAIGQFILAHPNIAAGQSYHNSGGMILRGPGASYAKDTYPRSDLRMYDKLGEAGEEMLPFYRYMVLYVDLYTVHGGFVNWLAEGLGIASFTNELWSSAKILQSKEARLDSEGRMRWQDRVLFGQTFTDFTEYDHPTLGRVLIGGGTKYSSRNTPPFMLEEGCHRNFAFTMFHAGHMPQISFDWVEVKSLGDDLWQITLEIGNEKIIPSRTGIAAANKIGQPDRLTLSGDGVQVVVSGRLNDRFDTTINTVKDRKHIIRHESGIPGEGRSTFRYLVTGPTGASVTLRYEAEKTMNIETTFTLNEENTDD